MGWAMWKSREEHSVAGVMLLGVWNMDVGIGEDVDDSFL